MKDVLRTPEERFAALPDFDIWPTYVEDLKGYEGLRMHLVDEGPARAPVFLCLHGEPTWSFLYRKLVPPFVQAGQRVIAPDFFGFGRSDKPVDEATYTFDFHRDALLALIQQRDLREITLVCQDWGGLIGLTLPMVQPWRFKRLVVINTMLATGDAPLPAGFLGWRQFVRQQPGFDIPALMRRACPGLSDEEAAGYDAPFPDDRYRAGVRRFPELVAEHPDDAGAALAREARDWLEREWNGETFMAIGKLDPVFSEGSMRALGSTIRGCPEPWVIENAGHFVQEHGAELAERVLAAFDLSTRSR